MDKKVVITNYELFGQVENEKEIMRKYNIKIEAYQCKNEEDMIKVVKDADGVIVPQYLPLPRRVIEAMNKCQVIVTYSIGVDHIDMKAATEQGICVANVPDYCVDEVSNHAIALIMALHRRLKTLDQGIRKMKWGYSEIRPIKRLAMNKLGIVALGRIGREIARKMKPSVAEILGFDPYLPREIAEQLGIRLVSLEELLKESDIITLHAPLTEETYHMIGTKELKMMRNTAILVNVARGGLIDENSLCQALREGWIGGAGLDVFEEEPITTNNPLLVLDKDTLIITPHAAWYSEESLTDLQRKAAEEVIRVLIEKKFPKALMNKGVKPKANLIA